MLRYLADAYKALDHTVPDDSERTEDFEDIIAWLGEMVRQVDSSLAGRVGAARQSGGGVPRSRPRSVRQVPQVTAERAGVPGAGAQRDVPAGRPRSRRRRWVDLAALDAGLTAEQWQDAGEAYAAEHGEVGIGPDARGPAMFLLGEPTDGRMSAVQILDDPDGERDWRITAAVDLEASDEAGEPVAHHAGRGSVRLTGGPRTWEDADNPVSISPRPRQFFVGDRPGPLFGDTALAWVDEAADPAPEPEAHQETTRCAGPSESSLRH